MAATAHLEGYWIDKASVLSKQKLKSLSERLRYCSSTVRHEKHCDTKFVSDATSVLQIVSCSHALHVWALCML